jgi:TolA-binding protein
MVMSSFAKLTMFGPRGLAPPGPAAARPGHAAALGWLLAASLFLPVLARAAEDSPDDYRLAVGFYNKEQWKLASESFQTFLKKNPRHQKAESARFFLALSLIQLDEFREAREILKAFVQDFPKGREVAAAGYWIGHCSFHLEDYPATARELTDFVRNFPENRLREWALPYLGDAELRLKKPDAAIGHFQDALQAFPEGALADDARFGLARGYEALGQTEDAIKAYLDLAGRHKSPRAAEAQLNLGALYFDAGRFADAASAYEVLEKQFPGTPQAPIAELNRGFALYQLGQLPQAIAQFDKAGQTEKYAGDAALWKGLCLKAQSELPRAIAVLEGAYEKYRDRPIAERILFQWADCEQRRGGFDKARELFLDVVHRWPKGTLADESLHAATQAALNAGNLAEAEKLLARFDLEFPDNRLRLRQEILRGRALAARNELAQASQHFQTVIDTSEIESTRQQARYYLADVLQKQREHAQVLRATEPLAALWDNGTGPSDLAGVFALRGVSQLELARAAAAKEKPGEPSPERTAHCQAAIAEAARYRKVSADGPLAPLARSVGISALALGGDKPAAIDSLSAWKKAGASGPEFDQTLYDLGTIAYSREDWEWADQLFRDLAERPKETRLHSRALADLGWTEFKRKQFVESAGTFTRLLADHPQDPLAPEAAFMRGSALQEAGQISEAQAAFAEAFQRDSAVDHVFLAGLQSARLLVRQKKFAEADSVYDALMKRFGRRADADQVLDEWASAHYTAENFPRADELFRRLVHDFPASPRAASARLSLAESDLVAGRLDQAREQLRPLTQEGAADATIQQRAFFQLMQIELESKRWDELRHVCDESLRRFPDGVYHLDARWRRAEADFRAGDYKAALERLVDLRKIRGDTAIKAPAWLPQVSIMLAETQYRLKDHAAAEATIAELRASEPMSPVLYQADEILGRCYKARAEWAKAREVFTRVVEDPAGKLTETAAKSQFHIGETYLFEKDFEAALKEYLKVDILYKFPEWQAAALFQAGVCQEALGQWKPAARTYEDLLKRYPENTDIAPQARERLEQVRKKLAVR